jgi:hypothetical protein
MARPVVNLRNSLAAASPQSQGFPSRTQTWRPSNASTQNRRTSVLPTCSESPSMTRTAPEIIGRQLNAADFVLTRSKRAPLDSSGGHQAVEEGRQLQRSGPRTGAFRRGDVRRRAVRLASARLPACSSSGRAARENRRCVRFRPRPGRLAHLHRARAASGTTFSCRTSPVGGASGSLRCRKTPSRQWCSRREASRSSRNTTAKARCARRRSMRSSSSCNRSGRASFGSLQAS